MNAYEFRPQALDMNGKVTGPKLCEDLAGHLRCGRERQLTFIECELPDGGRADVLTINPVYSKRTIHVYEVKTNRRDFWGDVNSGKYERYLRFAHRTYFAVPSGLVKKDEVPKACGLIVRGPNTWRVVKPAVPQHPEPIPDGWAFTLIDRAFWKDLPRMRNLAERVVVKENGKLMPKTYGYGRDVAYKLAKADRIGAGELSHEDAMALGIGKEVIALLTEAGHKDVSPYSARLIAETAVGLMRNAMLVREIGAFLSTNHGRQAEELKRMMRATVSVDADN